VGWNFVAIRVKPNFKIDYIVNNNTVIDAQAARNISNNRFYIGGRPRRMTNYSTKHEMFPGHISNF